MLFVHSEHVLYNVQILHCKTAAQIQQLKSTAVVLQMVSELVYHRCCKATPDQTTDPPTCVVVSFAYTALFK